MLFAACADEVWSVDVDPYAIEGAKQNLERQLVEVRADVRFAHADGIQFLREFGETIDLLYLDAWDVRADTQYAKRHLEAYFAACHRLHERSIILVDDVDLEGGGKGRLVVPWAIADGYQLIAYGRQAILARDPSEIRTRVEHALHSVAYDKGNALQVLAEDLQTKRWIYQRVGYDQREMTFDSRGLVREGCEGCELFWKLSLGENMRPVLELSGLKERTCALGIGEDGVWRGRWDNYERMEVWLRPIEQIQGCISSCGSQEKILIACLVNQLGNCLRALASCWILARQSGRRLQVFLGLNGSYRLDDFRSLFGADTDIEFVSQLPSDAVHFGRSQETGPYSEKATVGSGGEAAFCKHFTNCELHVEGIMDLSHYEGIRCIALTTIYSVRPAQMPVDEFLRMKVAFYESVMWNPSLICPRHGACEGVVGVHIRYTDNLRDQGKIKAGLLTPLDAFIDRLEKCDESSKILLCTDSAAVFEELMVQFGSRLRGPVKPFLGIQQAFYEMQMLARCKQIVGSASSTFSYEAAFMGPTPIELFVGGGWRRFHPLTSEADMVLS